ncbi:hypothetical protein U0070_009591, partial [Myodes glareolus]
MTPNFQMLSWCPQALRVLPFHRTQKKLVCENIPFTCFREESILTKAH